MGSYLSVKNKDGNFQHYDVPEEVAIYVKQLEHKIKYPEKSNLEKLYPNRFNNEQ